MGFFSHFLRNGTSDWHNWHYFAKERVFWRLFQLWLVRKCLSISLDGIWRIDGTIRHSIDLIFTDYDRTTCILFFKKWQPDDYYFWILVFCSLVRLKTWVTWHTSTFGPWFRRSTLIAACFSCKNLIKTHISKTVDQRKLANPPFQRESPYFYCNLKYWTPLTSISPPNTAIFS